MSSIVVPDTSDRDDERYARRIAEKEVCQRIGLFPMPMSEYQKGGTVPAFSSGIAQTILTRSALHAWFAHPVLNPNYQEDESARLDYGSAAHDVLLEGGEKLAVLDFADWRKEEAKEQREAARLEGKIPVLAHQAEMIQVMAEAARKYIADSELDHLFDDSYIEHAMIWMDGGTLCKARPDILTRDRRMIVDYKTCACAEPDAFLRTVLQNGYDVQGALYRRGNAAIGGKDARYVWLAQEIEPPFACSLVGMSPQMEEIGERKVQHALALWQRALESNEWRGYPQRIAWVEYPEWAARTIEEMLEIGGQG